jgi:rhodanese-related sulfurtransferase
MKKFISYFLLAAILPAFILTGCKKDDDKGTFTTLANYMTSNDLDLPDVLGSKTDGTFWIVAPTLTDDGGIVDSSAGYTIPGFHVFDIRKAADFGNGHVNGAINVALTDVLAKAKEVGKDKPILVICYTGQTACRAVVALRLSGYKDAKVMKFGMSYWNPTFDKWTPNVSDQADNSANWVTDASAALPVNIYPQWTSGSTDGATILSEHITTMLANTSWLVHSSDILANPEAHNIYNFWDEATYLSVGHFKDAFLYSSISITGDVLQALPTSDECLVYCYTGQTSSMAVAWLQVLGYNAKSIAFGVNSLRHTKLVDIGKPAWKHSNEYEYVTD